MKRLVIETRGGVVQEVYTDEDMQVVLIDWDEFEDDPTKSCASEFIPSSLSLMLEDTEQQLRAMTRSI
jgi:hypothetical protein